MDFDASKQALINVYLQQIANLATVIKQLLPCATGYEDPLQFDDPVVLEAKRLINQVQRY